MDTVELTRAVAALSSQLSELRSLVQSLGRSVRELQQLESTSHATLIDLQASAVASRELADQAQGALEAHQEALLAIHNRLVRVEVALDTLD